MFGGAVILLAVLSLADYLVPETEEMKELLTLLNSNSDPFLTTKQGLSSAPDAQEGDGGKKGQEASPSTGAGTDKTAAKVNEASGDKSAAGDGDEKKEASGGNSDKKTSGSGEGAPNFDTIKNDAKNVSGGATKMFKDTVKVVKGSADGTSNEGGSQAVQSVIAQNIVQGGELPISGLALADKKDNSIKGMPKSFWTDVKINNTVRRVKVSVKTVTVIDSVSPPNSSTKKNDKSKNDSKSKTSGDAKNKEKEKSSSSKDAKNESKDKAAGKNESKDKKKKANEKAKSEEKASKEKEEAKAKKDEANDKAKKEEKASKEKDKKDGKEDKSESEKKTSTPKNTGFQAGIDPTIRIQLPSQMIPPGSNQTQITVTLSETISSPQTASSVATSIKEKISSAGKKVEATVGIPQAKPTAQNTQNKPATDSSSEKKETEADSSTSSSKKTSTGSGQSSKQKGDNKQKKEEKAKTDERKDDKKKEDKKQDDKKKDDKKKDDKKKDDKKKDDKKKDDKKKEDNKKEDAALGDIIDILKEMPKGKGGSENTYVEGQFTFPKVKDLKDRKFKLTGYLYS